MSHTVDLSICTEKMRQQFARVINVLLSENNVIAYQYSPIRKRSDINPDFQFINANKSLISDFLALMDWELIDESANGYFSTYSETAPNALNLTGTATVLLMVLRKLYDDLAGASLETSEIELRIVDVRQACASFGLFGNKRHWPPNKDVNEAFVAMRRFRIIEKKLGEKYSDMDTVIIIYPSIRHAVNTGIAKDIIQAFVDADRENELTKIRNKQLRQELAAGPAAETEDTEEEEEFEDGDSN